MTRRRRRPGCQALLVAGVYGILAAVWILVSDSLIFAAPAGPAIPGYFFSLAKGLAFVLVTATVLYLALRRVLATIQSSEAFYRSTLDALPQNLAVLDGAGRIVATNAAWREFADANGGDLARLDAGAAYLAVCDRCFEEGDREAGEVAAAIRDIARGVRRSFSIEYPCHSPDRQRWFIARFTGVAEPGPGRVVASHQDITERKLASLSLLDAEARLHAAIGAGGVGLWDWDIPSDRVWCSAESQAMLGREPAPRITGSREWQELLHPEDAALVCRRLSRFLAGSGLDIEQEVRRRCADGQYRWFLSRGMLERDEEGRAVRMRGAQIDITERKRTERLLREATEHQQRLVSLSPDAIGYLDRDGVLRTANVRFAEMFGVGDVDGLCGRSAFDLIADHDRERAREDFSHIIQTLGIQRGLEYDLLRENGEVFPSETNISVIPAPSGAPDGVIAIVRDLTERRESEARIRYLSEHDHLTDLPNRLLLMDRLVVAISQAERHKSHAALLFVDVDRLKIINDSVGHGAGDRVLVHFAERLRGALRASDTVSREGGDEFLVLLPELAEPDAAARVASKLLERLARPLSIDGHELTVTASIGGAIYPENATSPEDLLRFAHGACNAAKSEGRNRCRFHIPRMTLQAEERLRLEAGLRQAVSNRELFAVYQPIVDLVDGHVVALEALVRWRHPTEGLISPGRFIPIAEDSGLIVEIGRWMLQEVCRQNRRWIERRVADVPVAVNVSALQFHQHDFVSSVGEILSDSGLEASRLELELTESVMMGGEQAVISGLRELDARGVVLAIDDFGTGYSSLSYLRRFPVHRLKIDQSFVRDLPGNRDAVAIARAVVGMGRGLGMRVIAEGIEREEQADFLQSIWCEDGQGYYYCKPLPPTELELWLESQGEIRSNVTLRQHG